jgi:hypothetical protein
MSQLTIDSSTRSNGTSVIEQAHVIAHQPSSEPTTEATEGYPLSRTRDSRSEKASNGHPLPPLLRRSPTRNKALRRRRVQSLKQEIKSLKDTLEETKHELSEANEAREASEQCAKALRDYISEFRVGEAGSSLSNTPPPPTTPAKAEDPKTSSKWSFKLWNGGNSATSPPIAPATPLSPPTSSLRSLPPVSSPQPPALTRKIGSFFSSRTGSVSSVTSFATPPPYPTTIDVPRQLGRFFRYRRRGAEQSIQ